MALTQNLDYYEDVIRRFGDIRSGSQFKGALDDFAQELLRRSGKLK